MIKKILCLFGAVFLLLVLLPTTVYALATIDNADAFPQMNDHATDGFLLKSPVLGIPVDKTPAELQTQSGPPWWTLVLIGLVSLGAGIGGSILVMKMLKKKE